MTDPTAVPPEEALDLLAAEYVLGLLEGAELRAAETRAVADTAFATAVDRWSERFASLLAEAREVAPPPALWPSIERAIADAPGDANVVELRRRAALWRGYGIGATAVAAALIGAIVVRPPVVAPSPAAPHSAMVATLAGGSGGAAMMASFDPVERSLTFAPGAMPPLPGGHAHELWIIPAGGAPHSLGVMPAGPGRMAMPAPLAELVDARATLAVSVEPAGGSPTGAPTGPVVASGKFVLV